MHTKEEVGRGMARRSRRKEKRGRLVRGGRVVYSFLWQWFFFFRFSTATSPAFTAFVQPFVKEEVGRGGVRGERTERRYTSVSIAEHALFSCLYVFSNVHC